MDSTQRRNLLMNVKRYTYQHPAFLYVFILPVFTIVRMLGEDVSNRQQLLPTTFSRFEYYLSIFFLIGIANFILPFLLRRIAKILYGKVTFTLQMSRFFAVIVSILFIATSYSLFFSTTPLSLYVFSGAHFFCIAYLSNLILLEMKDYNLQFTDKTVPFYRATNSAISSIMLNSIAFFAIGFFNLIQTFKIDNWYGICCVVLEVLFFIFLFFIKGYRNDFTALLRTTKLKKLILATLLFLFGFFFCMLFAYFIFFHPDVVIIFIPTVIYFAYRLSRKIQRKVILSIFSGTLSYGVILMCLMGSIPLLIVKNESQIKPEYTHLMSLEPVVSCCVSILLFLLIIKSKISTTVERSIQYNAICAVLIILLPIILYFFSINEAMLALLIFFVLYSTIETATLYCSSVLVLNQATNHNTLTLGYFNKTVYTLFMPSLFYLILKFVHLHCPDFSLSVLWSILITSLVVMLLNIFALYFTNK